MKNFVAEYWQMFKYALTTPWVYLLVLAMFFLSDRSLSVKIFLSVILFLIMPALAVFQIRIHKFFDKTDNK